MLDIIFAPNHPFLNENLNNTGASGVRLGGKPPRTGLGIIGDEIWRQQRRLLGIGAAVRLYADDRDKGRQHKTQQDPELSQGERVL